MNMVSFLSTPPVQMTPCQYVATRVGIALICTYIYSFVTFLDDHPSTANPDHEAARTRSRWRSGRPMRGPTM
jgi:hypothetical protein